MITLTICMLVLVLAALGCNLVLKYPPRYAYRIRPPFEVVSPPAHQLLVGGLFLAGLVIAVLGAFHDVQSAARKPVAHVSVASPAGGFQVLIDPKPVPAQPSLTLAEPAPTTGPQLQRQSEVVPTPLAPLQQTGAIPRSRPRSRSGARAPC